MTSPARPSVDDMVRELWDRQQISDVMLRFGRGLDLHDWELYAATLTDPFEVDFFDLTGRPAAVTTPKVWARVRPRLPGATGGHAPVLQLPHHPARR